MINLDAKLPSQVRYDKDISSTAKLLFSELYVYHMQHGDFNIHEDILCKDLNLTHGELLENLQALSDKEYLISTGKKYTIKDFTNQSLENIIKIWNEQKTTQCRKLSDSAKATIVSKVLQFGEQECIEAIKRYATVINDDKYFYKYKWNIQTFFKRESGVASFFKDGDKWVAYTEWKNKGNKKTKQKQMTADEFLAKQGYRLGDGFDE